MRGIMNTGSYAKLMIVLATDVRELLRIGCQYQPLQEKNKMKWVSLKDKSPEKSGVYMVRYLYSDCGVERESVAPSQYHKDLGLFDIETDCIPQCRVVEWSTPLLPSLNLTATVK